MLTYDLKKAPGCPLYEALYRCILADIRSGVLKPHDKLPSKRALSEHLELGKTTVEAAYGQLLAEGYLYSREKAGYYVAPGELPPPVPERQPTPVPARETPRTGVDLTGNGTGQFPFTVWSRLQREVILDLDRSLLLPLPGRGIPELRNAISRHLRSFRGMQADPADLVIGAGTDFLYNILVQLLGRDKVYAVEDPGYDKVRRIYEAGGARCIGVPLDGSGVVPEALAQAQVLHCSPSHHFPTGIITPLSRRQELLAWARRGNWIIEDDYDSEFRFAAHPLPALQSMAPARVIYINSFTKSLAPSIRISYMLLPPELSRELHTRLGFYGCTVPSFEQYTLARFLEQGHFEKHLNRMRRFYQRRRDRVAAMLTDCPAAGLLTIQEQDAGLHFLLKADTRLPDRVLVDRLAAMGIRVRALSSFYIDRDPGDLHCLVVNYSDLDEEQLARALARLTPELFEGEETACI